MEQSSMEKLAWQHSCECREVHYGTCVQRMPMPGNALEFLRVVRAGRPVIFTDALCAWPAYERWQSTEYLRKAMSGRRVTVAVTPDGRADAVVRDAKTNSWVFTLPREEQLPFEQVLDMFGGATGQLKECADRVYYVQLQNDNLRTEFQPLLADLPPNIPWASEAFQQQQPEAINLWLGQDKSVSSLHKDHYENLYSVLRGEKIFTLYPPEDAFFFPTEPFPTYTYDEHLKLVPHPDGLPATQWYNQHQSAKLPTPLVARVQAGEMLYLPPLFYHRVEQRCDQHGICLAVNHWYDMQFDSRFSWQRAWASLASQFHKRASLL